MNLQDKITQSLVESNGTGAGADNVYKVVMAEIEAIFFNRVWQGSFKEVKKFIETDIDPSALKSTLYNIK